MTPLEHVRAVVAAMPRGSHPSAPWGYGADLSCDSDIAPTGAEVSGTLQLAQALVRRLDCPRGAVPDAPDYGIDLRGHLSAGLTSTEYRALAGAIRGELAKDDRVESLTVRVDPGTRGERLGIALRVQPAAPATAFDAVLALTDGGAQLEVTR